MRFRLLMTAAALMTPVAISARATSFSSVIVYGDSLSDNGNLYAATGYPPSPYYNGRFSNGPVAVEQLAAQLNVPLYDFAFGGATTGIGNIADGGTQTSFGADYLPGISTEFADSTLPASIIPSSLFIVWGGADDFESGGSPVTAAGNVDSIVQALELEGATHILVPGLPDLALTPEFYGSSVAAAYTDAFNTALLSGLPSGATYVDTDALLNAIIADPSAYGFTNTTTPCLDSATNTVCSNPSQSLFFDDIHPTTAADTLLADEFAAAATPEPSSIALLGTGLLGLAGAARKRLAKDASPSGRDDYDPPSIPLVIDCPNQQGQDWQNLPRIIEFLSSRLPSNAQVIVTFEGDVPSKFDHRIELTQPRKLLQEDEFIDVFGELDGMLAIMNDALLRT